jgi:hypothetical protein
LRFERYLVDLWSANLVCSWVWQFLDWRVWVGVYELVQQLCGFVVNLAIGKGDADYRIWALSGTGTQPGAGRRWGRSGHGDERKVRVARVDDACASKLRSLPADVSKVSAVFACK